MQTDCIRIVDVSVYPLITLFKVCTSDAEISTVRTSSSGNCTFTSKLGAFDNCLRASNRFQQVAFRATGASDLLMCGPEARSNGDERFFFDLNVDCLLYTSDKPCIKYSNLAQCALFASIVNDVETSIPLKGSLTFLSTIPMHRESDGANSSRTLAGNTMRAPITLAVIFTFFVTKQGAVKRMAASLVESVAIRS